MIELKYMKKGCVAVLVTCLVVMILKYSLMRHHIEKYYNYLLLKHHYSAGSDKLNYNESDSILSSDQLYHPNIVTEKPHSISKCGYNVCLIFTQ